MSPQTIQNSVVRPRLLRLLEEMRRVVLGYDHQTEVMLLTICAGGHLSAVGEPGTGKTFSMKVLAALCGADIEGDGRGTEGGVTYRRVDMVPDLMPADLMGSEVRDKDGSIRFNYAVLTENLIFAHWDELNRTPPRTQSALLSAMEERRVNAPGKSFKLHPLFTSLATRNPIDSEGVYPLPIAQRDRFAVELDYGRLDEDLQFAVLSARAHKRHDLADVPNDIMDVASLMTVREEIEAAVTLSPSLLQYVNRLTLAVRADRTPALHKVTTTGVSPRAGIWLIRLAQARAYLHGRSHANADDVQYVLPDVLRHRILIEPMAEYQGWNPEKVVETVKQSVPIPN